MLSVAVAEATILQLVTPFDPNAESERIGLDRSLGRILASSVVGDRDFPHWDNAAMDGYAIRQADLLEGNELAIAPGVIPAAAGEPLPLVPGTCARIFTGGMLPEGADTVVMQEDTIQHGDRVTIQGIPQQGEYVRRRGEFYRAGMPLLEAGTSIGAAEIGILASLQCGEVTVFRRPVAAVLATGSELVAWDSAPPLQPGQIVDANQPMLSGLVEQAGGIPLPLGIVPDRPEALRDAIAAAVDRADLIISSGGVSVGDYDYVAQVLEELGATLHVRSVAVKPGKPLTVATFSAPLPQRQAKIYFGLPGNPVSASVCFRRFVSGAIAKLSGRSASAWYPQFIAAQTADDLHAQGRRETYLWGYLYWENGAARFRPGQNFSSGNAIGLIGANGLAVLKVNQTYVPAGETVLVMQMP